MAKADWEKRKTFALAYAECGNATHSALAAGVPSSSAHSMGYRWLRDARVVELVREAMNDRLKALGPVAIQVIQDILLSDQVPPQTRLQAARDLLDRLGWVPPKRPKSELKPERRELVEMSLNELEAMASGDPFVRLDEPSLRQLASNQ